MEAVGLGIGVVGLAGLLSSCLEAIDRVKAYRSFSSDSDTLNVQLEAEQLRLKQWGRSVGLDNGHLSVDRHQRLDDKQTVTVVEDLLTLISGILESNESTQHSENGRPDVLNIATFGTIGQPRTRDGVTRSRRHKLAWALGGKGDRTVQVTLLGKLVQNLHDLVPPHGAERTRTTADIWSLDALRGVDPLSATQRPDAPPDQAWFVELCQILAEFRANTAREVQGWLLGPHSLTSESYDNSRNKRLPGTCDWILARPIFSRWSAPDPPSDTPEILWIYGRPGFGKTILCSRIVEHLSADTDHSVAHFFMSSEHESRNDPYLVMRSWVSQLAAAQPEVFKLVRQKWETTQDRVAPLATVTKLLNDALRARPGTYLVLDGLDECTSPAESSNSVTAFLETLKNAITPATRVLITSREEIEIREALQTDNLATQGVAKYQISPEDVQADAASLSRALIDRKLPNKSEDDKARLSRIMADRCSGQLLWLKLQEQSLKKWKNLRQLQSALDGTPSGLDHVYERNWDKIVRGDRADRAVALLRWAAFASRPLTVSEISEAALIEESEAFEDLPTDELPDAIDDDYIGSEILGICGPLLEIRTGNLETESGAGKQTVHLAHFTVRQFLVGRLPTGNIWQSNELLRASNEQIQNTILARLCLWYVQSRQTWQNLSSTPGSPFRAAFREYSAGLWHAHVKSGVPLVQDPRTLEHIHNFMNDAHPSWNSWRVWFDMQDEKEKKYAENEDLPPTPPYYALKLDLTDVAVSHIRRFGYSRDTSRDGRSAFELCCRQGSIEAAEAILDAGVDVEMRLTRGKVPLHCASYNGSLGLVRLLLHRGAQINTTTPAGMSSVHHAVFAGHIEVVGLLIENGANVNEVVGDGWSPVHIAADKGHLEVVKLLLENGADVNLLSRNGWSPIHATAYKGHLEVVKLLLENGADVNLLSRNGWSPIHATADKGHLEVVKLLLENGADVNLLSRNGWSPVHIAADKGYLEVVKLLLENGADINLLLRNGWSPIHTAADEGHLEVVKLLLENGADINLLSRNGWSPIHTAADEGYLEVVKLLLENGADITVASDDGWRPFNSAARRGYLEVVEYLAGQGADVNATNTKNGETPVNSAARRGHLEVVKYLVGQGADIKASDNGGWTPVNSAVSEGHLEVVKYLVERGADFTATDDKKMIPMLLAAEDGHVQLFHDINDTLGNEFDQRDYLGRSALFMASRAGHTNLVEFLLSSCRADPTLQDWCGSTSLFAAVANGHARITELLIAHNTPPLALDLNCYDKNLLWLARRSGSHEVVEILLRHAKQPFSLDERDAPHDVVGFNSDLPWCDACTLGMSDTEPYHSCKECAQFALCSDCFLKGIRCPISGHTPLLREA